MAKQFKYVLTKISCNNNRKGWRVRFPSWLGIIQRCVVWILRIASELFPWFHGHLDVSLTARDEQLRFHATSRRNFKLALSVMAAISFALKPHTDEQVFLDKEPGLKASPTSFSTRKLARVYVQQGTLDKGIFVYVLNSCGLVKVVRKKILSNFAYTGTNKSCQEQLVKENLFVVQTRK